MIEMNELQGKTAAELVSIIQIQQENFRKEKENFTQEKRLLKKDFSTKARTLKERFSKKEKTLEETLQEKSTVIQNKTQLISQLQEYIVLLKQGRFGSSSERFVDSVLQGSLFNEAELEVSEAEELAEEAETNSDAVTPGHAPKKKTGARKPLPDFLPRKQVIHDISDAEKQCQCGCELRKIGEVKSEQLEIIPAQLFVIEHIQNKYACNQCDKTIKTASKPKQPIHKGMPGPGLLAHVLSEKFEFHLPLYRQEQRLQRIGIDIPRATLSQWAIKCSELLQPLANLLEDEILTYDLTIRTLN